MLGTSAACSFPQTRSILHMEHHPLGLTRCSFTLPVTQTLTPLSPGSRNKLCWLPCTATRPQSTAHTSYILCGGHSCPWLPPLPKDKNSCIYSYVFTCNNTAPHISAWPSKHKVCCTLGFTCVILDLSYYSQWWFIVELTCKYSRMHTVLVYF